MSNLSVIIPTLNEEHHVGALLSDVADQTRKADEVLVVDAGSTDDTVPVVQQFPFAKLLEGAHPVARSRNVGGQGATGDVLIFLDADVRLADNFFERFLYEFEERQLDVAFPLYVPYRSTPAVERFHALFNIVMKAVQGITPSGAGMCIAVRGDLFREGGGFDRGLKFDELGRGQRVHEAQRLDYHRGHRAGSQEHFLLLVRTGLHISSTSEEIRTLKRAS